MNTFEFETTNGQVLEVEVTSNGFLIYKGEKLIGKKQLDSRDLKLIQEEVDYQREMMDNEEESLFDEELFG